ncbi:MAG TPA: hypothetical protein VFQ91_15200 [Bryobacteraceae bacterium]|nr:hypothetical protein [Bryobacteraceae bacterium]
MRLLNLAGVLAVASVLWPVCGQDVNSAGAAIPVYDGPAILGRGGSKTGMRGKEPTPIHLQASINGSYDSSILGYSVDNSGSLHPVATLGVTASLNVNGRKVWRRSYLGIDYGGNYNHFAKNSFYNGTNHQLNLSAGTQFNAKWALTSDVGAGTSNRFLGGPTFFTNNEFEFLNVPTSELFDSRSYFLGTTTSAIYSFSRRQSLRFGGTGSTVRRKARGLVDMQSYGANSDWVYRINRNASMGVSYSFTHYDFTKVFGETDVHTIGWHYGRKFGRSVDFSVGLTGAKQSTVGVRTFALDPVLAAILGRSTGQEVFETNNLIYGYQASIGRRIRRSNITASAQRGIVPGNGFFLASINHTAGVSFNYTVTRDLALAAVSGYSRMTSLSFSSGAFSSWNAGAGATYKLTEDFGLNARYDWRTFDLQQTNFGRTGYRVSIGVTYYPQKGIASIF